MAGQRIDIETGDGVADSYLALPEGEVKGAVLFVIDVYGLRPRVEEMADRIAAEGYAVLAPNVFYRAGRAPVLEMPDATDGEAHKAFFAEVKPLVGQLMPGLAADGGAYLDALAEHAPGPAAITGYCMGGRLGWKIATAHPDRVAALGCFHTGGLATNAEDSPHRAAADLDCELYFGFADQDPSMSAEAIAELESALDAAGASYRAEVYAGAQHGYTMADTSAWNEEACERHFRALFDLLGRTLAAN
jgi:carboxymethylenebutenolidase